MRVTVAKIKLSKQALQKQREQLRLYQRLLPSLDLKRRQLSLEYDKARRALAQLRAEAAALEARIGAELPMMANPQIDLQGLVRLGEVYLVEENVVGVKLPQLERADYLVGHYSFLVRPAWVDVVVERLQQAIEQALHIQVAARRVHILQAAMRRVTQRVNLFERMLIPTAKANIARIRIYLGDVERDAVVRSKIAKSRHAVGADIEADEVSAP